jgi:DNA polymerase-3 subunit beta
MQISFQREELLKPLSYVAGIVERRQTLPILSYILLKHKNGQTTLTGTDLEVEVVATAEATAKVEGEMTIPARKLLDICRALPETSSINIKREGEKAVVKAGKSRFTLLTMPVGDFPNIQSLSWEQTLTFTQKALKKAFEETQFCMAQQDVRYYLNGLLIELHDGKVKVVATDGHRMAVSEVPYKDARVEKQVIVPRKAVQEITRMLEDSEEKVTLQLNANHICIQTPSLTFTSKLIDGRYPDYSKVVPANQATIIKLAPGLFHEALTRAAILSSEKYRGVRLTAGDKTIRITAHNPEQEEAQEEINVIEHEGPPVEVGFNVSYLIDATSALANDEAILSLNDPNSSCTLRPTNSQYPLYVIMPMRL